MADTSGCSGYIKVKDLAAQGSATRIYQVKDWEFSESAQFLEVDGQYIAGATQTIGTITIWWNSAAQSNHTDMVIGSSVELEIHPYGLGGDDPGFAYYTTPTGGAIVHEISRKSCADGIVESSFSFSVNGRMNKVVAPWEGVGLPKRETILNDDMDALSRIPMETAQAPMTGLLQSCWWVDDGDYWETACGHNFNLLAGTPAENHMKYCPYCGRLINDDPPGI